MNEVYNARHREICRECSPHFHREEIKNSIGDAGIQLLLTLLQVNQRSRIDIKEAVGRVVKLIDWPFKRTTSNIDISSDYQNFYNAQQSAKEAQLEIQKRYENNEFSHLGPDFGISNTNRVIGDMAEENRCRILFCMEDKVHFYCSHLLEKEKLFSHLIANQDLLQQNRINVCFQCEKEKRKKC